MFDVASDGRTDVTYAVVLSWQPVTDSSDESCHLAAMQILVMLVRVAR